MPDEPKKRRVWLWLVGGVTALAVIGPPAAYWAWTWYEQHALLQTVAAYRDAGEPVTVDALRASVDIQGPNRVTGLREAWRGIDDRHGDWRWVKGLSSDTKAATRPIPADDQRHLRDLLAANRARLDQVAEATRLPGFRWDPQPGDFVEWFDKRETARVVALTGLIYQASLLAHQDGDDRQALEYVRQLLVTGRTVQRVPDGLAVAVGQFIETRVVVALRAMLPTLRVGRDGEAAARELIAMLTDRTPGDEAWQAAMRGMRVNTLTFERFVRSGKKEEGGGLRPFVVSDTRVILAYADQLMRAGLSEDWPAAKAAKPERPFTEEGRWDLHEFGRSLTPEFGGALAKKFELLAYGRLLAAALASKLYAEAHGGAWPNGLADLVPTDLPSVPTDPMATGGRPVGYVGGGSPVFYSVGLNGADDHADPGRDFVIRLTAGASR